MPRSSRSKSHKQSKHGAKEAAVVAAAKEYTDSEEDVVVVKMKERNGKEDSSPSVRVSREFASGEKRKFTSSAKDGKDLPVHSNGDAGEDYVASKRRKEKESDRWNGGGDEKDEPLNVEKEMDKVVKVKDSKSGGGVVEPKSKTSSRRHESGSERKEESSVSVVVVVEKEESKGGGGNSESKRKGEKDFGRKEGHQHKDSKESKEKDRGSDRERKVLEGKRGDAEVRIKDGELATRKQGEDQQSKRGREHTGMIAICGQLKLIN